MYPANLESSPNVPPLIFCIHSGKSSLVVSVAISRAEIVRSTHGSAPLRESYHPNSGPNAILAATIRGRDRNNPNWLPRAEYATPLGAFPESSILWPGNSARAVSAPGAPISAEGIYPRKVCTTPVATIIPAAAERGIPIASSAGETPSRISATLLTWKPGIKPVSEPMHTPMNNAASIQPISRKNPSIKSPKRLQHHRQFHCHFRQ